MRTLRIVGIVLAVLAVSAVSAQASTYSGNGSKQIGVIKVTTPSTTHWTNRGDPDFLLFLLYDDRFGISISSQATHGSSYVGPGTYRNITVAGEDWSFTITSNSAKPKPKKRLPGFNVTAKEAKDQTIALMKLEQSDFFHISTQVSGKLVLSRFLNCRVVNRRRQNCTYYVKGPGGKGCFVSAVVTKALRSRKPVGVRGQPRQCGFSSTPPGAPTVTK